MILNVDDENARMYNAVSFGGPPFEDLTRLHPDQPLNATKYSLGSTSVPLSGIYNTQLFDDIVMAKDYATDTASLSVNGWKNNAWVASNGQNLPWPLPGSGVETVLGARTVSDNLLLNSNNSGKGWSTKGTFIFGKGWRNIQFIWINDDENQNTFFQVARGYWMETSRQILSPRTKTDYSNNDPSNNNQTS